MAIAIFGAWGAYGLGAAILTLIVIAIVALAMWLLP
jgi:hypothetical protein